MRIALLSSTINITNGYGNITYEYCSALHRKGIEFTLFLPQKEKSLVASMNLPFKTQCILPKYLFRFYQDPLLTHFRTIIDVSAFDLVHSLYAFPYCIIGLRSARKYKKPFMMGEQGTYGVVPLFFWPEKCFLKWCYRSAKRIVVPSDFTRRKILDSAQEEYSINIIHNGVNFERFQAKVDTAALKKKYEGKTVLLTVGGLKERKGHDLVVQALAKAIQSHPQLHYVMVGSGHTREPLMAMAQQLGIADHIEFVGSRKGEELVAYFQVSDIYIHTPKVIGNQFEGFGIVYLEASVCGKPIIAADAGGIRDAVMDGETGLIVPDGDVDAIAASMTRLCDDSSLASKMGAAGKEYARTHDWRYIVDQFLSHYTQLV